MKYVLDRVQLVSEEVPQAGDNVELVLEERDCWIKTAENLYLLDDHTTRPIVDAVNVQQLKACFVGDVSLHPVAWDAALSLVQFEVVFPGICCYVGVRLPEAEFQRVVAEAKETYVQLADIL